VKILLIDNHALFRDALRYLLQQSSKMRPEILEAENIEDGLIIAKQNQDLELVLLEINSPGCNGSLSVARFHTQLPDIPLVVVSSDEFRHVIKDALKKGARGFVCKSSTGKNLMRALTHVSEGGIYIPQQMKDTEADKFDSAAIEENFSLADYRLTSRQCEVLNYLVLGFSNKKIARAMNIAEGTAKVHVAAILQTLHVNNRRQAIQVAEVLGLIRINSN
jgi:DNA-binding NarL/FixJ family response regulator